MVQLHIKKEKKLIQSMKRTLRHILKFDHNSSLFFIYIFQVRRVSWLWRENWDFFITSINNKKILSKGRKKVSHFFLLNLINLDVKKLTFITLHWTINRHKLIRWLWRSRLITLLMIKWHNIISMLQIRTTKSRSP